MNALTCLTLYRHRFCLSTLFLFITPGHRRRTLTDSDDTQQQQQQLPHSFHTHLSRTTRHNSTPYHPLLQPLLTITFEMLTNGLTILTALLPLLSVASAAHAAPRHRRHHDLAARDEPSPRDIAQVAPRANAGHAEAKRAIRRVVKKRGAQQQCRARGSSAPSVAAQDASSADSSAAAASSAVASAPAPAPSSAAPSETPAIPNQNAWADQASLILVFRHPADS